jgi:UDP-2,4-diacetamido-2,4,6-trideoxy-beta-L-altropyranose hydrolase
MTAPRVEFVVDCGAIVGMGHLSRAQTLAEALAARGGQVRMRLTAPDSAPPNFPFPIVALEQETGAADLVIVEGLGFTAAQAEAFRKPGALFVVVDDLGDRSIACDVLINQNIYGDRLPFHGYSYRQALLGAKFALIKPGFADARGSAERGGPRPLITFGGGATAAIGVEVARRLATRFSGPIDLALGGALGVAANDLPGNVMRHYGADMPALMARATLYVGSLGVTFLEALAVGLPVVAACVADNQRLALDAAKSLGLAVFPEPDLDAIVAAAEAAMAAPSALLLDQPDGRGAARVADALLLALAARPVNNSGDCQ